MSPCPPSLLLLLIIIRLNQFLPSLGLAFFPLFLLFLISLVSFLVSSPLSSHLPRHFFTVYYPLHSLLSFSGASFYGLGSSFFPSRPTYQQFPLLFTFLSPAMMILYFYFQPCLNHFLLPFLLLESLSFLSIYDFPFLFLLIPNAIAASFSLPPFPLHLSPLPLPSFPFHLPP